MKRKVRLTEGDLHRIIKESVKRVLREGGHLMNSYRVDIHLPNSGDDINNEYFDNKAERKSNVMAKNFKQTYTVVRIG